MAFTQSEVDGITVITVEDKRFDALIADQYKTDLSKIIEEGKARICMNLEKVQFIDSSGLNVLIFAARQTREKKGALKLACCQPQVRDMFEMTRINRMIPVFPTQEEALKGFAA
jgi:anti-sigma B factor antagonist